MNINLSQFLPALASIALPQLLGTKEGEELTPVVESFIPQQQGEPQAGPVAVQAGTQAVARETVMQVLQAAEPGLISLIETILDSIVTQSERPAVNATLQATIDSWSPYPAGQTP